MAKIDVEPGESAKYTREKALAGCLEDLAVVRQRLKTGGGRETTHGLTQASVMLRYQALRIAKVSTYPPMGATQ